MWKIGYKDAKNSVSIMRVDIHECSPKDHYLYLYDVERIEVEREEIESDISEVEPDTKELAHVRGYFNPTAWLFAVSEDVIIENELNPSI